MEKRVLSEQDICYYYMQNLNTIQLGVMFNCSDSTINRILTKNNIPLRNKKKFSIEVELEICKQYINDKTTTYLAKKYNCSDVCVGNILRRHNITLKNGSECQQKYKFNKNYFDIIDTPEKAYWLGFIYADGCNHVKRNTLSITLQESDKYLLENFQKCLNIENKLILQKGKLKKDKIGYRKNLYSLNINNKHISEQLLLKGVVARKSLILTYPKKEILNHKLYNNFILGYFDGDGGLYYYPPKKTLNFHITGTKQMLTSIKNILIENCKVSNVKLHQKNTLNNTYTLQYGGNTNCMKICNWLYKNSTIYLKRKYDKFQLIC